MVRASRAAAVAALVALWAASARGAGERVVVQLRGGAKIHATLVAEDEASVTLATPEGTVKLPRSAIAKLERPDAQPRSSLPEPPAVPRPAARGPSSGSKLKPWPEAEVQRVETLLDRQLFVKMGGRSRRP